MKSTFTFSRLQIVLAAFALVLATSAITYSIIAHNEATQRQSREDGLKRLSGRDGENFQQASATVDMMAKSTSDRLSQVMDQCNKKKVSNAERRRLLMGTYNAGKEASDKVAASYYQAPFEPHYPPLPQ